jgi:hypothetical protein
MNRTVSEMYAELLGSKPNRTIKNRLIRVHLKLG